jgi:hypothetical protein
MELVSLESTKRTPSVLLDPSGRIRIGGRSIPEDASRGMMISSNVVNTIPVY